MKSADEPVRKVQYKAQQQLNQCFKVNMNRVQGVLGVVYQQVTHMNMNMEKIIWYIQVKSQRIMAKIRNDVAP